jgi:hypothetical protein
LHLKAARWAAMTILAGSETEEDPNEPHHRNL